MHCPCSNSNRIINLASPQNNTDAVNKKYVDESLVFKKIKIADNLNLEDIAMMILYSSCAELETILNEAAILAAYSRRDRITIKDMVKER